MFDAIYRRHFLAGGAAAIAVPHSSRSAESSERLMDRLFLKEVRDDPLRATQLGISARGNAPWSTWTIRDDEWQSRAIQSAKRSIADVRRASDISPFDRQLFCYLQEERIERARWSGHDYIFYSTNLPPVAAMSALIEWQRITDQHDLNAYVQRVRELSLWIEADTEIMRQRAANGVIVPSFNFPIMEAACKRLIIQCAAPDSHPLVADMSAKSLAANLAPADIQRASRHLSRILSDDLRPAIARLRDELRYFARLAKFDHGVWALPDGAAYYASQIQTHTTLREDPSELHRYGLDEVARLRAELGSIGPTLDLGHGEDVILKALVSNQRFYLPNTDEGRRTYVERARQSVAIALSRASEMISLPLRAALEVREVDPISAPTAGRAFYVEPGAAGSPGIFFVNTYDMRANPAYQLEAVVHHEAVPGHHLQAAVQAGSHMPLYRRQLYIGAFAEGWGLYAEKMAEDFGLYTGPEARAGRIALELFRAARLVVDTGIHTKRWSLEVAVRYMNENTANARQDNVSEVQRYFNWPGQALAYKVGMREIERRRITQQRTEGKSFDLRRFHDGLLIEGSRPLFML